LYVRTTNDETDGRGKTAQIELSRGCFVAVVQRHDPTDAQFLHFVALGTLARSRKQLGAYRLVVCANACFRGWSALTAGRKPAANRTPQGPAATLLPPTHVVKVLVDLLSALQQLCIVLRHRSAVCLGTNEGPLQYE
jgi:hypothetical protein